MPLRCVSGVAYIDAKTGTTFRRDLRSIFAFQNLNSGTHNPHSLIDFVFFSLQLKDENMI
jgi:hypothetical protein